MARYEHLPVYKTGFDLLVWTEEVVRGFSRYHKYTIGTDLRNQIRKIVNSVVEANGISDKIETLRRLRLEIESMMLLVRVAKDVKAFPNVNSYGHAVGELISLARQSEGWLKSQHRKQPESPT